jgi:hypothetical protein
LVTLEELLQLLVEEPFSEVAEVAQVVREAQEARLTEGLEV